MNKHAVVTWASGTDFCTSDGFKSYIESLSNIPNADFFVFTHNIPYATAKRLQQKNIRVIYRKQDQVNFILRDRHLAYSDWLNYVADKYELFLFTDSKDVIFQKDPFEDWNGKPIMLTCEGMEHKDSLWNLNDQTQVQIDVREFKTSIQDRPVLNGGIVMGQGSALKFHFFIIWSNTLKSIGPCTDQATLNFLYNWLERGPEYSHTDPRTDTFCLTGEAVKEGLVKKVVFEDGLYKNLEKEVYSIVHQWDRLPEAEQIIERYKS